MGCNDLQCWEQVRRGAYGAVYLATPPWETGRLLERLLDCDVPLVVAEKPWFADLASARRFRDRVPQGDGRRFRFFDHYHCRPALRWLWPQPLEALLGGPVEAVTGWLLETKEPTSPPMRLGVLTDLLIHLISVCRRLLPGCPIEVVEAHAARYRGAPIPADTFARVRAVAEGSRAVQIDLAAAKACPADGAGKVLLVHGPDAALRLDLAHDSVHLVSGTRTRCLYVANQSADDAHLHLLRHLADGDCTDSTLGVHIDEAISVLEIVEQAHRFTPRPLPEYEKGQYPRGWPARELPCDRAA